MISEILLQSPTCLQKGSVDVITNRKWHRWMPSEFLLKSKPASKKIGDCHLLIASLKASDPTRENLMKSCIPCRDRSLISISLQDSSVLPYHSCCHVWIVKKEEPSFRLAAFFFLDLAWFCPVSAIAPNTLLSAYSRFRTVAIFYIPIYLHGLHRLERHRHGGDGGAIDVERAWVVIVDKNFTYCSCRILVAVSIRSDTYKLMY